MPIVEIDGRTWSLRAIPIIRSAISEMREQGSIHALYRLKSFDLCQRRYFSEIECRVGINIAPYRIKFINGFVEIYVHPRK